MFPKKQLRNPQHSDLSNSGVKNRTRQRDPRRRTALGVERLEERLVLAVVIPDLTTGSLGSALINGGLTQLVSEIPSSTLNETPPADISVIYHAFPQEKNEITVTADLLNTFLYFNEDGDDIFTIRLLPAFNDDLIEDFNFTLEFIAGIEIPVAHLLGLDFPDVEAIVPNPDALSQFIPPEITEIFSTADRVLNTRIFPGLKILGKRIIPDLTVGRLISTAIPGPVDDLLIKAIEILGGGRRGGVQLHLLDGADTADLSDLTGVVQEVHGGVGSDVLMGGGTDEPLEVLGSSIIANPADLRISLFGEEGMDTFVVNRKFNVNDYRVHGGSGNDLLVIPGTDGNDIFHIVSNTAGQIERIEFRAPGTGGAPQNEQQVVTRPTGSTGFFTLTFGGQTTDDIAANASALTVETELELLSTIDEVSVSGADGGPWTVEFDGFNLAAKDQFNMAANGTDLSIVGGSVKVVESLEGGSTSFNEVQTIALPAGTTGGEFSLSFGGESTGPIPTDAGASEVRSALAGLSSIGGLNNVLVTSSNSSGGPWDVEFAGALGGADQSAITTDLTQTTLTGFNLGSSVSSTQQGILQVNERQRLQLNNAATGEFLVTFGGFTTALIPASASALALQNILSDLPSIGQNIIVTGSPRDWVIEWAGPFAGTDVPFLTVVLGSLNPAFASISVAQGAVAGRNETQTISLNNSPTINGGTFTLTFDGLETDPIDFDATAQEVRAALGDLSTIGGLGNVQVTGASPTYVVTFVSDLGLADQPLMAVDDSLLTSAVDLVVTEDLTGGIPVNEIQTISLPANTVGGQFTLSFDGAGPTNLLDFDASAADVETELELLSSLVDVEVSGPDGGPWNVEFQGAQGNQAGIDIPTLLSGDGSALVLQGLNIDVDELQSGTAGGDSDLLVTTTITEFSSIEQLRIDGEGGDDTVIFEGVPIFSQGIFFDGADGADSMEIISNAASPAFNSPIFPDGTAATVFVDGQAFQFGDMEANLIYDANGATATASLSGTDEANDIRFNATGDGAASFANDGQVTTTLRNFGNGSSISILAQQGDDAIAVALNGFTAFTTFFIDGGGPAGADAVTFEGTPTTDAFEFTPGANVEDGTVTIDGTVTLDYTGMSGVTFLGRGGLDSLAVNEASADTNDVILFFPQVGNDGSFQLTSQSAGPGTALVYPTVDFGSIESRTFSTGTGTDVLSIASDDLPGVNSSASVVGGNGTTTASFGDQSTTFIHDVTDEDSLSLEIGTADDDVTVTPGAGIAIAVNTALGNDLLTYNGAVDDITLDVASATISQLGLSDVTFSSAETVLVVGNGANALTVLGAALAANRFRYKPTGEDDGEFSSDQALAEFLFSDIGGTLTFSGGLTATDIVEFEGTIGDDSILVDGPNRTIAAVDPLGTAVKAVTLATNIEIASVFARDGDDLVGTLPSDALFIRVDGGPPNASDRVFVEDQDAGDLVVHREGPDRRSGSVVIGDLDPVSYVNSERVDIIPIDPITGGTGSDGFGTVVVLDDDPFEHNETLPTSTRFEAVDDVLTRPNIDPGVTTSPNLRTLPGDEDWYRFRADKIGTFSFEVLFERVDSLPGAGELTAGVYRADGSLITDSIDFEDGDVVSFSADRREDYFLRVRGESADAINVYDLNLTEVDLVGPEVFDPDGAGPLQAIQITADPTFNLFVFKGSQANRAQGPTPAVESITINLRDLLNRVNRLPDDLAARNVPNGRAPGDLYPALDALVAQQAGHYQLRGDANGVIPIKEVIVTNDAPVEGQIATATVELVFDFALPDDHYTFTIFDTLIDPPGNGMDGRSTATQPSSDFVSRFAVDTRPEVGTFVDRLWYIDLNGNGVFDPNNADPTNRDVVWTFGAPGDFPVVGDWNGDGFDEIGVFGLRSGVYMFELDVDANGAFDPAAGDVQFVFADLNARPISGDWDGDGDDDVGLFDGKRWYLDLNGDRALQRVTERVLTDMRGRPVAGDWDGTGTDRVGTYRTNQRNARPLNQWSLDIDGNLQNAGNQVLRQATPFGGRKRPVTADWNADGDDNLGIFKTNPRENAAEWFLDLDSNGLFEPPPTGKLGVPFVEQDIFYRFGDNLAEPIAGNFDPPPPNPLKTTFADVSGRRREAYLLELGGPVASDIDKVKDRDWFSFVTPKPGRVAIDVTTPASDLDSRILLVGPGIRRQNNNFKGSTDSYMAFRAKAGAKYSLLIRGVRRTLGDYVVNTQYLTAGADDHADRPGKAATELEVLFVGPQPSLSGSGQIQRAGESDYFQFVAQATGKYRLTPSSSTQVDAVFTLFDAGGNAIRRIDTSRATGDLFVDLLGDELYYIRVKANAGQRGAYAFSLT